MEAHEGVENGNFDNGLSSWTPLPGAGYTVGWDFAQGNVGAGAATVDLTSSAGATLVTFLEQCGHAEGATTYDVGASFRFPASVATKPLAFLIVEYFSDEACTVQVPGSLTMGLSSAQSPADTWLVTNIPKLVTTPVGTRSARFRLRVVTQAAGSTFGWFDDILFAKSPLEFFTIEPCRVVDTRGGAPIGGPALVAHTPTTFTIVGHCGVPIGARAVSVNVVATESAQAGNLRLYAAGTGLPQSSTVNYGPGQTRANNAVLALSENGGLTAFVSQDAGSTVHFILDVNGYFR